MPNTKSMLSWWGEAEREGGREGRAPRVLVLTLELCDDGLLPRVEFSAPCHLLRGAVRPSARGT